MRILIIGGGGREHAIAWALSKSPQQPDLFIAPGNAGTAPLGTNLNISPSDIPALLEFAQENDIGLTIVGPEQPLVEGAVDRFEAEGLRIVGPTAAAARLEGSKAFAKEFMERYGIPTAAHRTFSADQYAAARQYVDEQGAPIVIKASGLAAGKGAVVCQTLGAAYDALGEIMQERAFGAAGDEVVVEAFMEGEEASIFALCDGKSYVLLAPAQDHKRIGEGDTGPNTGGMGAYAPAPVVSPSLLQRVCTEVIEPVLAGMKQDGTPYRGVLYAGLMMTAQGPKVVEFNCRFGDPEAQVLLPMLKTDPVEVFAAMADKRLGKVEVQSLDGAAVCVVMASEGYPGSYPKGRAIRGLEALEATDEVVVFHAGTRMSGGEVVTSGGRVLGVMARGEDLDRALEKAYSAVETIHFEGMQYRRDIGHKGLAHLKR